MSPKNRVPKIHLLSDSLRLRKCLSGSVAVEVPVRVITRRQPQVEEVRTSVPTTQLLLPKIPPPERPVVGVGRRLSGLPKAPEVLSEVVDTEGVPHSIEPVPWPLPCVTVLIGPQKVSAPDLF